MDAGGQSVDILGYGASVKAASSADKKPDCTVRYHHTILPEIRGCMQQALFSLQSTYLNLYTRADHATIHWHHHCAVHYSTARCVAILDH